MLNDEGAFLLLRLFIERIFLMDVVELVQKIFIAATGEAKSKQISRLVLYLRRLSRISLEKVC